MFVRSPSRPSPFPFSSVPVPLLVRPRSFLVCSPLVCPLFVRSLLVRFRPFLARSCSPSHLYPFPYRRSQTAKPSPNDYAQTYPILSSPPVSLLSFPVPRPWRRQTETAPPNGYAQNPSAQPNGDGTTKRLRSEPVNAAKRRRHRQTTTLRPIQSSPPPLFPSSPSLFPALGAAKRRRHHQTATLRGQEVMSSRVIRAPLPTASSAAPHL